MMWEDPQEVFKDYNIQFIKLSAIILRSLGPLEDLALITGYNCAFIRNMENGQRRIHLDTGALLAQSLDVPFYVFLRIPMLNLDIGKRSIFELKPNIKS
jgi:hypothetical protein